MEGAQVRRTVLEISSGPVATSGLNFLNFRVKEF